MSAPVTNSVERRLINAVFRAADALGVSRLTRWVMRDHLLVLCYHAVVPDDTPEDPRTNIAVTESQFETQVRELRRHWQPVHEEDVLVACMDSKPLPDSAVLVTFDDGFRNNIEFAAPLLKEYEVPAVFFVSSALIGTTELLWTQELTERVLAWPENTMPAPNGGGSTPLPPTVRQRMSIARESVAKCKALPDVQRRDYLQSLRSSELRLDERWQKTLYPFMTWSEVRKLRDDGFSIGAHTLDHPILTSLSDSDLSHQLRQSKEQIENELRQPCTSIAYPNGGEADYSADVIRSAEEAGYRLGYTLRERRNPQDLVPMEIDRVCMTRDVSADLFRCRTAGWR